MKKIISILIVLVFLGSISVSAQTTIKTAEKSIEKGAAGTFEGEIGYIQNQQWNKVGEITGSFNQNRVIRVNGNWMITVGQYNGTTGTLNGFVFRYFIILRASIDSGRTLPIIGFIKINQSDSTFVGRFMSIVGPALYFKGSYI